MFKLKVKEITPVRHQATGDVFLEVSFDIKEEKPGKDIVVESRKLGFAPDISKAALKAELDKVLDTYNLEQEQKAVQKEQDAQDEHVASLRTELVGVEIKSKNKHADSNTR